MSNPIADLTGAVKAGADAVNNCTELLKIVYGDALQPAARKVGKALETVIGYSNVPLLYLRLGMMNAEYRESAQAILFKRRLQEFRASLKDVPEAEVTQVPNEIGVPVLEKLTYVTDNDLASLFLNLLKNAALTKTANLAHPSFVRLIEAIAPDEAKLMLHIQDFRVIPYVTFHVDRLNSPGGFEPISKAVESSVRNKLRCQEMALTYFSNLEGLGLIKDIEGKYILNHRDYELIESMLVPSIIYDSRNYKLLMEKGYFQITPYGDLFVKACTNRATSPEFEAFLSRKQEFPSSSTAEPS